jgi:hypothetical protein
LQLTDHLTLFRCIGIVYAQQAVHEVSLDGGKVRLRGAPGEGSCWRDYKAARLNGVYYGVSFQAPWSLTN